MKALVIGATGIIGNHVTRALLKEGHSVRAFQRGITPAKNLEGLDVERVRGDIKDADSLKSAMKGCNWVFHTAPYYPTSMFGVASHVDQALHGIESVLTAFESAGADRLVYTSSLTTIGVPATEGVLADETCLFDKANLSAHPYFRVKYLMEERVREEAARGLPAVIVNPTGCFGDFELKAPNLCLVPQLISGKIPAYIDRPINAVDVADVGRGHVLAAMKGKIGERYILGGHNLSAKSVIEGICKAGGVKAPKIQLPISLALSVSFVSEAIATLTKSLPALPILGLKFLQYGQHLDISKAKSVLGYQPHPMEPCYERAIKWFREIGYC